MRLLAVLAGATVAIGAVVQPRLPPLVAVVPPARALQMQLSCGEEEAGAEACATQMPLWRQRLRSTGRTLFAATILLASSRRPAFALDEGSVGGDGAASVTRSVDSFRERQADDQRVVLVASPSMGPSVVDVRSKEPVVVDLDGIIPQRMADRFTSREFIFDESLTVNSELEYELSDYYAVKEKPVSTETIALGAVKLAGGVAGFFYTVKGLVGIERWMRQQEQRDIEEEMELTGTYVSVDAGDVDTAFDPLTGKNITINRSKSKKDPEGGAVASEAKQTWMPAWLSSFVGNDPEEEGFWKPPEEPLPKPKKKKKKTEGAGGDADSGDGPSASGDGSSEEEEEEEDDDDDDSSGLDVLDGLLG